MSDVTLPSDTRMKIELRRVLHDAGVEADVETDRCHLDLSGLDSQPLISKKQAALQTTASLLFSLPQRVAITAKLPVEPKSRRILSATGLMFALVEHHADFEMVELEDDETLGDGNADALFPLTALQRLSRFESWRTTFTPFDPGLRELRLGVGVAAAHRSLREIGVYDKDLSSFVNPHQLPQQTAIQDIRQTAEPWLFRLLDDERESADKVVSIALELLSHALDNVREHAFLDQAVRRSLVTVGQVDVGDRRMFRLQIMDNGVGIPASLGAQLNRTDIDRKEAERLLALAARGNAEDEDPLLPWGRGQGLPRMRDLSAEVDGVLTIATRGPEGSQVLVTCEGDRPSAPYSDLVPVAGTVVTLLVPIQAKSPVPDDVDTPLDSLTEE